MIGQIILAISFVINLFFLLVLTKRRNDVTNTFSFVIGGVVVWTAIVFLWPYFQNSIFILNALGVIAYWGPLCAICSLYYFSFIFPKKINNNYKFARIIAVSVFVAGVAMTLIPNFVLKEAEGSGYKLDTGPGLNVLFGMIAVLLFWALVNYIRKYFVLQGIYKTQLKFLFIGIFITSVVGFISNALLASLQIYDLIWLGPTVTLFLVGFTTYAITRYRLMDVRLIVARTIAFGSIIILLVSLFSISATLLALFTTKILGTSLNQTNSTIISGIIISILVAFGYQPLLNFIGKATDRFLFKKTYNPDELLSRISDTSSAILELNKLVKELSKILAEAFQFEKIGIVMLDEKGNFNIVYKEGFKDGVAEGLARFPDVSTIFNKELEKNPGLQVIPEMKTRYESGEFEPVSPILLEALSKADIAVVMPLYVKDDLVGLVALGEKKSGDSYTQQDLITLDIVSGQIAIAIENARLYDELKYFNVKLEQEVKEKTAELRSANSQLKRLDQAKSDFISIASHQLRTPLTVIKGYISMMQEGSFGKVPQKIDENLTKVFLSNERLINLVEDLLNISRIESGRQQFEWTKVNLVELAQRLTESLEQNAKAKGLTLKFHQPKEEVPIIIAEYNKLHDVMINFIDNAIKYTAEGKIDVTVENGPKGMVTFKVKDTGRGIDPDTMASLFQKFSRGQGSFQVNAGGTGLGLYVAKMIVDAHEGKIWAESEGRDKGSAFCFSLPVAGPKKKTDLPFAKEGQKVEKPVASAPVASVPAVAPSQLKKEGKKKKKK